MKVSSAPAPQIGNFALSAENAQKMGRIFARYPSDKRASAIIPLLDLAQRENGGWLSKKAIEFVALQCDVAPIRVYEVASFYTMFYTKPMGRNIVQVCRTTPCWLRGSDDIAQACKDKLGIELGETTADGNFSLIEVECLGACCNAPMVQINDDFYEDLNADNMVQILEALERGEQPQTGSQSGRMSSEPEGGRQTLLQDE